MPFDACDLVLVVPGPAQRYECDSARRLTPPLQMGRAECL